MKRIIKVNKSGIQYLTNYNTSDASAEFGTNSEEAVTFSPSQTDEFYAAKALCQGHIFTQSLKADKWSIDSEHDHTAKSHIDRRTRGFVEQIRSERKGFVAPKSDRRIRQAFVAFYRTVEQNHHSAEYLTPSLISPNVWSKREEKLFHKFNQLRR